MWYNKKENNLKTIKITIFINKDNTNLKKVTKENM